MVIMIRDMYYLLNCTCQLYTLRDLPSHQARQTRQNSGGGGGGLQRGGQNLTREGLQSLFNIYAIKYSLFRVSTLSD